MKFSPTTIAGAWIVDLERRGDERGYFARAWCQREAAAHGLDTNLAQINISANARRGTLRGLHFQAIPRAEAKVVSCTRGAILDVMLDLRPDSPSYLQWQGVELSGDNRRMLYIPPGCAHGFQSLTDNAELLYFMSEFYSPEHGRGVRYDDPAFAIDWPLPVSEISPADRTWPDYQPLATMGSQPQ
jgi:dTDP-4-dehydrorhamnose 3,5-epimerase